MGFIKFWMLGLKINMDSIMVVMDADGITAKVNEKPWVETKVGWDEVDKFRKGVIHISSESGKTEKGGIRNGNNE